MSENTGKLEIGYNATLDEKEGEKGTAVVVDQALVFKIHGSFDKSRFAKAFDRVVDNNDVFRIMIELKDRSVDFNIGEKPVYEIRNVDVEADSYDEGVAAVIRLIRKEMGVHISANRLWDAILYRLSDSEHIFFLRMNHAITDGHGNAIILHQIIESYNNGSLEKPEVTFKEHLDEMMQPGEMMKKKEMMEYWAKESAGYKEFVDIPDSSNRKKTSYKRYFGIEREGLYQASRQLRTSLFNVVLFLAHAGISYAYNNNDSVIASVIDTRSGKYVNTAGLFVDIALNRLTFDEKKGIRETFETEKKDMMLDLSRARVGLIMPEMSRFIITYQNFTNDFSKDFRLGDAVVELFEDVDMTEDTVWNYICLYVTDSDNEIRLNLAADPDMLTEEQKRKFEEGFRLAARCLTDNDMTYREFIQESNK